MDAAKKLLKDKGETFLKYAQDHRLSAGRCREEAKQYDDAADQYEREAAEFLAAAEKLS